MQNKKTKSKKVYPSAIVKKIGRLPLYLSILFFVFTIVLFANQPDYFKADLAGGDMIDDPLASQTQCVSNYNKLIEVTGGSSQYDFKFVNTTLTRTGSAGSAVYGTLRNGSDAADDPTDPAVTTNGVIRYEPPSKNNIDRTGQVVIQVTDHKAQNPSATAKNIIINVVPSCVNNLEIIQANSQNTASVPITISQGQTVRVEKIKALFFNGGSKEYNLPHPKISFEENSGGQKGYFNNNVFYATSDSGVAYISAKTHGLGTQLIPGSGQQNETVRSAAIPVNLSGQACSLYSNLYQASGSGFVSIDPNNILNPQPVNPLMQAGETRTVFIRGGVPNFTWSTSNPLTVSVKSLEQANNDTAVQQGQATASVSGTFSETISGNPLTGTIISSNTTGTLVTYQVRVTGSIGIGSLGGSVIATVTKTNGDVVVDSITNNGRLRGTISSTISVNGTQGQTATSQGTVNSIFTGVVTGIATGGIEADTDTDFTIQVDPNGIVMISGVTVSGTVSASSASPLLATLPSQGNSGHTANSRISVLQANRTGTAVVYVTDNTGCTAILDMQVTSQKLELRNPDDNNSAVSSGALAINQSRRLEAYLKYPNFEENVTNMSLWHSENDQIATASAGLVRGVGPGITTIFVTYGTGAVVSKGSYVASVGRNLSISPVKATVVPGGTLELYVDGGSGSGTFMISQNNSMGGNITADPNNHLHATYTAGTGEGTDKIKYVDSLGSQVETEIEVVNFVRIVIVPNSITLSSPDAQATITAVGEYSSGATKVLTNASWASTDSSVATISNSGIVTAKNSGNTKITASLGAVSAEASIIVNFNLQRHLTAINLAPTSVSLTHTGATSYLQAVGVFSDGTTEPMTDIALWSSSAANIATVSSTGAITSVLSGEAAVTAGSGGVVSNSVPVRVDYSLQRRLTGITVAPSSVILTQTGAVSSLQAVGQYSDGTQETLTNTAVWSSSASNIVSVSNGAITAIGIGNAVITVQKNGIISSPVRIKVDLSLARHLTKISVSPPALTLTRPNATAQLQAVGQYSDGTQSAITAASGIVWSTSDSTVASVSNSGLVTALSSGTATITAGKDGVLSGSVQATVDFSLANRLTAITLAPPALTLTRPNATAQLQAVGQYSDGTQSAITAASGIVWSTSDSTVASVSNSGLVTALSSGTATITAGKDGVLSGSVQATVDFSLTRRLSSIQISPDSITLRKGEQTNLTYTGTMTDGVPVSVVSGLVWNSTNNSIVNTSSAPNITALSKGTAVVTAGSGGVFGTANITVNDADIINISLTASGSASIDVNQSVQLAAQADYSDGGTSNVTNFVDWVSSNENIAVVDNTGLVTGIAAGTSNITAHVPNSPVVSTNSIAVTVGAGISVSETEATMLVKTGRIFHVTGGSGHYSWTAFGDSGGNLNSSSGAIVTYTAGPVPGTDKIQVRDADNLLLAPVEIIITVTDADIDSLTVSIVGDSNKLSLSAGQVSQGTVYFRGMPNEGDKVSIAGITYTAVSSDNPNDDTDFEVSSNIDSALTNLTDTINSNQNSQVSAVSDIVLDMILLYIKPSSGYTYIALNSSDSAFRVYSGEQQVFHAGGGNGNYSWREQGSGVGNTVTGKVIVYTPEQTGTSTIILSDTENRTAQAFIDVQKQDSGQFSLQTTVYQPNVEIGDNIQFTAQALLKNGIIINNYKNTDLVWESDNESLGVINATGRFEALEKGVINITAKEGSVISNPYRLEINPVRPRIVSANVSPYAVINGTVTVSVQAELMVGIDKLARIEVSLKDNGNNNVLDDKLSSFGKNNQDIIKIYNNNPPAGSGASAIKDGNFQAAFDIFEPQMNQNNVPAGRYTLKIEAIDINNNRSDIYEINFYAGRLAQGDANGDGIINIIDAIQAARFLTGASVPKRHQIQSLDFNGNLKIDLVDVIILFQRILSS